MVRTHPSQPKKADHQSMVCFSFFWWDGAFELYLCLPLQTQMWFVNKARAEVCLQARGSPKFFLPWQKASIHPRRCVSAMLTRENFILAYSSTHHSAIYITKFKEVVNLVHFAIFCFPHYIENPFIYCKF